MTEADLLRAAARLGRDQAEGLDADRIAEQVLARLATEPVAHARPRPLRRRVTPWLLGLAAAAAVLLTLRLTIFEPPPPAVLPSYGLTVLQELDDLQASELEEILEAIPAPAGDWGPLPETVPWSDLDSGNLERLLRSLEG